MILCVTWALVASGCRAEPARWSEIGTELERQEVQDQQIRIEPQSNRETAQLSADDVIVVMKRIGFSPEQILDFGPALHDAVLHSGAARVRVGKRVEAILQVRGRLLFIRSNSRGSFIYDLDKGRFGLM